MKIEEQKGMAERIKERRKSLGYTQEEFAEAIGISAGSYTRIENAFQKPALDTLVKISRELQLSLDYAVFGEEEQVPKPLSDKEMLSALVAHIDSDKLQYISDFLARVAKIKDV